MFIENGHNKEKKQAEEDQKEGIPSQIAKLSFGQNFVDFMAFSPESPICKRGISPYGDSWKNKKTELCIQLF